MLICDGTAHMAAANPEWADGGDELLDEAIETNDEAAANTRALSALEQAMSGVTRRG